MGFGYIQKEARRKERSHIPEGEIQLSATMFVTSDVTFQVPKIT